MGDYADYSIEGYLRNGMRSRRGDRPRSQRTRTEHGWGCPCCGRLARDLEFVKGHHRDVHGQRLKSSEWEGCRLESPVVVERSPFLKEGAIFRSAEAPSDNSSGVFVALMVADGVWEIRDVEDTVVDIMESPDTKEGRRSVSDRVAEIARNWSSDSHLSRRM